MTPTNPAPDRVDRVWQQRELATKFVNEIRAGVPLGTEQLELMLRVIEASGTAVGTFLDLGCGDGILGRTVRDRFPEAAGVFLDFSDAMIEAARSKCGRESERTRFVHADFGTKEWIAGVRNSAPFDLIVSGFAIHHQPDERKRELYAEVFGLLRPSGLFLNLEHVASRSAWGERAFETWMIDSLWSFHRQRDGRTREEVAREYVNRPDWSANILAPVEDQCEWLREIGFIDVDCFFKAFELALFGGRKRECAS